MKEPVMPAHKVVRGKKILANIRYDRRTKRYAYDAYRHSLENHVLPKLGHLALEDIKPLVLKEHLLQVVTESSLGVATQARSALAKVMEVAAVDGRVAANPAKSVRISARQRKLLRIESAAQGYVGKRWLTLVEAAILLQKAIGTWPILLGLQFGHRSGESLGLKWSDVDLKAKVVRVRR